MEITSVRAAKAKWRPDGRCNLHISLYRRCRRRCPCTQSPSPPQFAFLLSGAPPVHQKWLRQRGLHPPIEAEAAWLQTHSSPACANALHSRARKLEKPFRCAPPQQRFGAAHLLFLQRLPSNRRRASCVPTAAGACRSPNTLHEAGRQGSNAAPPPQQSVVEFGYRAAHLGPILAELVQCWPISVHCLAGIGPTQGRHRPNFAKHWPLGVKLGQLFPTSDVGQIWTKPAKHRACRCEAWDRWRV